MVSETERMYVAVRVSGFGGEEGMKRKGRNERAINTWGSSLYYYYYYFFIWSRGISGDKHVF
jgi:hypothetical protein